MLWKCFKFEGNLIYGILYDMSCPHLPSPSKDSFHPDFVAVITTAQPSYFGSIIISCEPNLVKKGLRSKRQNALFVPYIGNLCQSVPVRYPLFAVWYNKSLFGSILYNSCQRISYSVSDMKGIPAA